MWAYIKKQGRAWMITVSLIWGCVALGGYSFYKTFELASDSRDAVKRLQVVEAEVQQIIQDSLLDCPSRAKARLVIRTALLADPDISYEIRNLIEADFREIDCSK